MKSLLFTALAFLTGCFVQAQDLDQGPRVLYHSYSRTASSYDVVEWNVGETNNPWLIRETIDDQGRVVELEFLERQELLDHPLCYLASRVTFEYTDNQIIETLYHGDEAIIATECETEFKSIYHLDEEGYITHCERFFLFDFTGMTAAEQEALKEYLPDEHVIVYDSLGMNLEVEYYYHSFAKLNGHYPVNKNYTFEDDYYYGDSPEKESILEGLK